MPTLELTTEQMKAYFGDDKSMRHCFYEKTVEMADEIRVHADGLYAEKLLEERRPNEPAEVLEYRKKIFSPKTKPFFNKIMISLSKIRRSSDWSILYRGEFSKIKEGETLQDYCEMQYPYFTSVTNWVFQVLLKHYLIDPNAVLLIKPLQTAIEETSYLKPFIHIFESCNVIEYVPEDFCVLVNPEGCTYKTSRGTFSGKSFFVVTTQSIIRYDQINNKNDFAITDEYKHELGEMPAYRIGAFVKEVQGMNFLYESRVACVLPEFDEAIREYSDLQAAKVLHIYPERWEYTQHECTSCKGTGKRRNPAWYQGCGTDCPAEITCDNKNCQNGYVVASPYSKIMVRPASVTDGSTNIPLPPAGYVEKDVEIVKVQESSIDKHIYNGLAALNFEFLMKTPLNESGLAKEVDRDELNTSVHTIAEDLVQVMDWCYSIIAMYRYRLLYTPDEIYEMLPSIAVPEKYDILSSSHIEAQLTAVKTAKVNPAIVSAIENEYAVKAFSSNPEVSEIVSMVLELDPMANVSEEDKMSRLSNKGITLLTYIVSSNINEFVKRAVQENVGFDEFPIEKKKEIIYGYAQAQIDEQAMMIADEIDETADQGDDEEGEEDEL